MFQWFAQAEASGGIVLLACSMFALLWANSRWADSYGSLWHTHLVVEIATARLDLSLHHWINDGLMAIFFFVVGLEIKRELFVGELSSRRQAALPVAAALGGMLIPAILYTAFNLGGPGEAGWGIPMATDIAFAIGVLALLGQRVPLVLKVFLTALAIVDDLGAVLVIAVFYTSRLAMEPALLAGVLMVVLIAANRAGVRHPLFWAAAGVPLWLAVHSSGVHATIAGVLLAFTIPLRARLDPRVLIQEGRGLLTQLEMVSPEAKGPVLLNEEQLEIIRVIENQCDLVQTPLHRFEHALHPWVVFGIMPLFALANAGVAISVDSLGSLGQPVGLGILAGLIVGKPLGITLFSWLAVRSGLAELPPEVRWQQLVGVSILGGIGFTMSLFITGLAFATQAAPAENAKLAILLASVVSGLTGLLVLSLVRARDPRAA
jgi:NhaA family Na+:H+ antiporter